LFVSAKTTVKRL